MRQEAQRGSRSIAPFILTLGIIMGWVIKATLQPLYPWGKENCRGWWVRHMAAQNGYGEEKISWPIVVRSRTLQPIASATKYMKSALFWSITQCRLVVFLSKFRDLSVPYSVAKTSTTWIFLPLKIGPISCPETSVKNYQYRLRNIPEERRSYPGPVNYINFPNHWFYLGNFI